MRALTITTAILILSTSSTSRGESHPPENSEENELCGYRIEGELAKEINTINSEAKNGMRRKNIDATIELGTRDIPVSIEFSCHTSIAPSTEISKTAKSEIEKEDSGGRYYRIVNWEKSINGKNWSGTMAYINTTFGDGEKITAPDQFFICPNESKNPCFYINIDQTIHLSTSESKRIQQILSDISMN